MKKTKQWIDEDGVTRFTKLKFLSKGLISEILEDYSVYGLPYYKIAIKQKISR